MKKQLCFCSCLFALLFTAGMQQINAQVSCITGTGETLNTTGPAVCAGVARFNGPFGIDVDASGNVYVADEMNNRIRKIEPNGTVSILAGYVQGSQNGTGTGAYFFRPTDVAVDASGNVYVADKYNNRIRKITSAGVVTTLAGSTQGYEDGTGTAAKFYAPNGIDIDAAGNIYVADRGNHRIRKITPAGVVTTVAGSGTTGDLDGTGTAARFTSPADVAVDASGNLYVTDEGNALIRKITPAGVVTVFAGGGGGPVDGTGTDAVFYNPFGICIDASGNLYVADSGLDLIRKITPAAVVTSIGNSTGGDLDGSLTTSRFNNPMGVAADVNGKLFVADYANHKIKKVDFTASTCNTYAGRGAIGSTDGSALATAIYHPSGMVYDASGNLYVAEHGSHVIKKIAPDGTSTVFAGSGIAGPANGTGTAAQFSTPTGLAIDASGNLYVADQFNNRIRKITPAGVVTTLAGNNQGMGDGTGSAAAFYYPTGLAIDASGNLYVTDMNNNRIRKVTPAGVVTTLAGGANADYVDGTGTDARFNAPMGIYLSADGNLYVADRLNHRIRKVSMTGVVTTVAGSGAASSLDNTGIGASFNHPIGITGDAAGNLYVTEYTGNKIRKIDANTQVTTVAGSGTSGYQNGATATARFSGPYMITISPTGNLIVSDRLNHRLREVVLIATSVVSPSKSLGEVLVYPNPVQNLLYLDIPTEDKGGYSYIMNSMGEVVAEQSLGEESTLDVSKLPSGVYVLKVVNDKGYRTQKFVKE